MKETGKKTLAWLLTMLMLLGMLPGMALAGVEPATEVNSADALTTALSNAPDGSIIRLTADIESNTGFTFDRSGISVTLDLNGYGIKGNGSSRILTVKSGTLTLNNSSSTEHLFYFGNNLAHVVQSESDVDYVSAEEDMRGRFTGGYITGGNADYDSGGGAGVYVYSGATFAMEGGTIIGNNASSYYGGAVYVQESATFTMNGGGMIGNYSSWGGTVYLKSGSDEDNPGGTFTMSGGSITDNYANSAGGGVYVDRYANFAMSGGSISGNTATGSGGGVYVYEYATFTMSGGSISGNTASGDGGGVYVDQYATFTMETGRINGNYANDSYSDGGGVYVSWNATFIMNDGEISENSAECGGGVYVCDSGSFNMSGGSVTDNTADYAAGVYTYDNDNLSFSGESTITGNLETGNIPSNLVLALYYSDRIPQITAADLNGGKIGVTAYNEYTEVYIGGVFTQPLTEETAEKVKENFTSDINKYTVAVTEIESLKKGESTQYALELVAIYPVLNAISMEHGKVTASENRTEGETVTLTVEPDSGYRLKSGSLKAFKGVPAITMGDIVTKDQIEKMIALVDADFTGVDNSEPGNGNGILFDFDGLMFTTEDRIKYAADGEDGSWVKLDESSFIEATQSEIETVRETDWRCILAIPLDHPYASLVAPNLYVFSPVDVIADGGIFTYEEITTLMQEGKSDSTDDNANQAVFNFNSEVEGGAQVTYKLSEQTWSLDENADENALKSTWWQCDIGDIGDKETNSYSFMPTYLISGKAVDINQIENALNAGYISKENQNESQYPYNAAAFLDSFDMDVMAKRAIMLRADKAACYTYSREDGEGSWEKVTEGSPVTGNEEYSLDDIKNRNWVPYATMYMDILNQNNCYVFTDCTVDVTPGSKENTYTFTMPNNYVTVSAEFEPVPASPRSSGGSSTPTITVPVTGDNTVQVSARVSGSTANVQKPTEKQLDAILGASHETGEVTVDVSGMNRKIDTASIPAETLGKFSDAVSGTANAATGFTVKLSSGSVTLDAQAFSAVNEQTKGTELSVSLQSIGESSLSSAQKTATGDMDVQAVYDAFMTSGGRRISDFKGGKATVTVPYTLKSGQIGRGVAVWYIADDGSKTEVPSAFDGKDVRFTVEHFSNYAIVYDAERAASCPQDATCPIGKFADTDAKAWYHDGVHWALENGVMNGVSSSKFNPDGDTSRAMVVTMLWRMEGSPAHAGASEFADVDGAQWYAQAVRWANAEGIVTGFRDANGRGMVFDPNGAVTREQLAAILYRYAQYRKQDVSVGEDTNILSYDDALSVSAWAMAAMQWACGAGVINGIGGNLAPMGNATRAQVATMLMRHSTAK